MASDTEEEKPKPRVKKLKPCPICCFDVPGFTTSPDSCKDTRTGQSITHLEGQKCCEECWEAHIAYSVETKPATEISCIFCESTLSDDEIRRLCYKKTRLRYEVKLEDSRGIRCVHRCVGVNTPAQPHDRERDGRVFSCAACSSESCIDCDRPEHPDGEDCFDFWDRNAPHHDPAEAAMSEAGYKQCPSCLSWGELSAKPNEMCDALQCDGCQYRWCGGCGAAWCGRDSYWTMGMRAHKGGCKYARALPSVYARKRLYEDEKEAWDEAQGKKKQRKIERIEKKQRKRDQSVKTEPMIKAEPEEESQIVGAASSQIVEASSSEMAEPFVEVKVERQD